MSVTFDIPSPADWRAAAEKALKDRPVEGLVHLDADGLAVRPLYARATGVTPLNLPRSADADGRAWDLRTLVEADEPEEARDLILGELGGGAASVIVKGAVLEDSAPLGRALDGVRLELAGVALDAGLDGHLAANALAVAAKGSPRARLMFHLDPVSAFAEAGVAPRPIEEHLRLAANAAARHATAYPQARLFMASGRAAHEAGGSIAQELAFACADAVALIDAAVEAGMTAEAAVRATVLGLAIDQRFLDGIAKVRALRLMWRTLSRALGAERPATIEARSSRAMLGAADPWPNLLRLTAAGFAGAVGGAEAVVLDGFDRASGRADAFALRQARNTQLVLMEEAHLGRVDDPAAGSWFLDQRTRELAEAGWAEFQVIQAEGGLVEALKGGVIQPRIARARQGRERALAEGQEVMAGVNRFVDPEPRPATIRPEPVPKALGGGDVCEPLTPVRWAGPLEPAIGVEGGA